MLVSSVRVAAGRRDTPPLRMLGRLISRTSSCFGSGFGVAFAVLNASFCRDAHRRTVKLAYSNATTLTDPSPFRLAVRVLERMGTVEGGRVGLGSRVLWLFY